MYERTTCRGLAAGMACAALLAGPIGTASAQGSGTRPEVWREAIIGGQPSGSGDAPSAGALLLTASLEDEQYASLLCSGVLIAPDVVLTAAHCVHGMEEEFPGMEIFFTLSEDVNSFSTDKGAPMPELPPRTLQARSWVFHPEYTPEASELELGERHDLGLVFLERPVTDVVPAVVLRAEDGTALATGLEVLIAGYGKTSDEDGERGRKYHASTVIGEVGTLEMEIGGVPPTPQKCKGDSGGPTYHTFEDGLLPAERVIGVTSHALSDACDTGGADTRIDAHLGWLREQLVAACQQGLRSACGPSEVFPEPAPGAAPEGEAHEAEAGSEGCALAPSSGRLPVSGWPCLLVAVLLGARRRGRPGR